MSFLDRILPPRFDDFDLAPDDAFLDTAFSLDELTLGAHGLVSAVPHGGRIPWDEIAPWATFESGWDKRGAPVMNPKGQIVHWTASKPSTLRPAPAFIICRDGRPAGKGVTAVPGPLCNAHIAWTGKVTILASGRANHAGVGDQSLLPLLAAGKLTPGKPGKDTGGCGGSIIGYEVEHPGDATPYPPAVLASIERLTRAVSTYYKWLPQQTLDHARWTRRKIDCISHRREIACLRWLA